MPHVVTGASPKWPAELSEQVRRLWALGLSAGEILKRLPRGHGRTRNAIIGQIHRQKWEGGSGPPPGLNGNPKRKRVNGGPPRRSRKRNSYGGIALKIAQGTFGQKPAAKKLVVEPVTPPTCAPVRLIDSEPYHCRFVIGKTAGPDTKFCGSQRQMGGSFCSFHRRLAYQPPDGRGRNLERLARAL